MSGIAYESFNDSFLEIFTSLFPFDTLFDVYFESTHMNIVKYFET